MQRNVNLLIAGAMILGMGSAAMAAEPTNENRTCRARLECKFIGAALKKGAVQECTAIASVRRHERRQAEIANHEDNDRRNRANLTVFCNGLPVVSSGAVTERIEGFEYLFSAPTREAAILKFLSDDLRDACRNERRGNDEDDELEFIPAWLSVAGLPLQGRCLVDVSDNDRRAPLAETDL